MGVVGRVYTNGNYLFGWVYRKKRRFRFALVVVVAMVVVVVVVWLRVKNETVEMLGQNVLICLWKLGVVWVLFVGVGCCGWCDYVSVFFGVVCSFHRPPYHMQ